MKRGTVPKHGLPAIQWRLYMKGMPTLAHLILTEGLLVDWGTEVVLKARPRRVSVSNDLPFLPGVCGVQCLLLTITCSIAPNTVCAA